MTTIPAGVNAMAGEQRCHFRLFAISSVTVKTNSWMPIVSAYLPALDASVFQPGRTYGIRNLASRWMRFDVEYVVGQNDRLTIRLSGKVKVARAAYCAGS